MYALPVGILLSVPYIFLNNSYLHFIRSFTCFQSWLLYQADYYSRINAELDKRPFFVGEQVWNFADFATIQGPMRVDGNKKGLLTRDRRPKLAAHYFRKRWRGIPDFGYKA